MMAVMGEQAVDAELRRVAGLTGGAPLSVKFYDEHRAAGALTAARIIQRSGSWRKACAAAGVETNKAARTYRRRWSREDLLGWVRDYLAADGQPSYGRLSTWLREQPDAPSANTIRNTFGTWTAVLEAAMAPAGEE